MSPDTHGVSVSTNTSDYTVNEALLSAFAGTGQIQTTAKGDIDGEEYTVEADVKLVLRVATAEEMEEFTDGGFDRDWKGERFVRYAKYMVNWKTVEILEDYKFDPETGIVQPFDEEVDRVAQLLYDREPLAQEPGFLFPARSPNDGPPPITDYPEALISKDIQYQLRALAEGEPFCIDWVGANELYQHLSALDKSGAPVGKYNWAEQMYELNHIGGGRPHVDSVETRIQASLAWHKDGLSLGLWFPYQPVTTEQVWDLAEDMGATFVTAAEEFPSKFSQIVPPGIWNCFPHTPRNHGDPEILTPCLVQLTIESS
jgi:hypothetical protein